MCYLAFTLVIIVDVTIKQGVVLFFDVRVEK